MNQMHVVTRLAMPRWICRFLIGLLALASVAGSAADNRNAALAPHAQDLVVLQHGQLVPFAADKFLSAPYTVLYFGAGWCPDCRRFSPALVKAYDHQPQGKKRFEVLLLTKDHNTEGMRKFMRTEKMTWPAIAFEKVAGADDLQKFYSGHGIPCLSIIDQQGRLLLQSKSDQDAKVILKQLDELLKNSK